MSDVLAELKRLQTQVEQLARRNAELEKRLNTRPAADPALEQRVRLLEENAAQTEQALGTERLSQAEPELVTRLKAVEMQALSMQKQARAIESLEGITAGVSLTMVGQGVDGATAVPDSDDSQLNYRGDVFVGLPGGEIGNAEGSLFFQMRVGQGEGVNPQAASFSVPNATAFKLGGADDDSTVLLAQAWYQLDVPLPLGGVKDRSREHLEINFGKMDPFVFFDQNAAADDETAKFVNLAFVHNPLLDAGAGRGLTPTASRRESASRIRTTPSRPRAGAFRWAYSAAARARLSPTVWMTRSSSSNWKRKEKCSRASTGTTGSITGTTAVRRRSTTPPTRIPSLNRASACRWISAWAMP